MNFHWLDRGSHSVDEIKKMSNELEEYGYSSILFTYSSNKPDNFIKVANAIDKKNKIKYMIAIRPHATSPEYLKMQCEAFNEIAPDRLIINFVAGHIQQREIPPKYNLDERRTILYNFLNDFNKISFNKPIIAISGSSDIVLDCATKYADILITELSQYLNKQMFDLRVDKKIVLVNFTQKFSISEDESSIIKKILSLQEHGIGDIMVAVDDHTFDKNQIHNIVKKIKDNYPLL